MAPDTQIGREAAAASPVTPVEGPSWLTRLRVRFPQTGLGRAGEFARAPIKPPTRHEPGELVALSGADLYRLNCQSCHEADGTGFPPEVGSIVQAVRDSSVELMHRHDPQRGRATDGHAVHQLPRQADGEIRRRIRQGGDRMPARPHLDDGEIDALMAHLRLLADLPDASRGQIRVAASVFRLGEHLVKGTCHICHDATGPRVTASELWRGAIPAIDSFVRQASLSELVQKVRAGTQITAGAFPPTGRGRMRVFSYLTPDEVAAAYVYLVVYPPR